VQWYLKVTGIKSDNRREFKKGVVHKGDMARIVYYLNGGW